jgi:hypothetical protein
LFADITKMHISAVLNEKLGFHTGLALAQCKHYSRQISRKESNTTGLARYLKRVNDNYSD